MNKSLILLAISVLSLSSFAQVTRGSLTVSVSAEARIIVFDQRIDNILILQDDLAEDIKIKLDLAAENQDELARFSNAWGLFAKGSKVVELEVSPRFGSGSNQCQSLTINGKKKVEGVCKEDYSIILPQGLSAQIGTDSKSLIITSTNSSTDDEFAESDFIDTSYLTLILQKEVFESKKVKTLKNFLSKINTENVEILAVEDFISIVKIFRFSSYQIESIELMAPYIQNKVDAYMGVQNLLTFKSDKDKARIILLGN